MKIAHLGTPIALATIALFSTSVLTTSAVRASVGIYGSNLVVNGGAEADQGSPSNIQIVKPSGWTTTGQFTAVQYGASGGFPDTTTPGPSARGKNFFAGGNVAGSTATQTISLASAAGDIQSGVVHFAFAAWIGGYGGQADHATVTLTFRSATGASLGGATLGPVTPSQRGGTTSLLQRTNSGIIPRNATSAVVTIVSTRLEGEYNDGYVDNVSLILSK